MYLEAVSSNDTLAQIWSAVITELKRKPLHNNSADPDNPVIDKWWNSTEGKPNTDSSLSESRVLSLKDWSNMLSIGIALEIIYSMEEKIQMRGEMLFLWNMHFKH